MASRRAVTAALKMFALTFAGDVSTERIDLYAAALEDVDDAALAAATTRLVKTHTGEWIPVPAVVRVAAGANPKTRVDVAALLRRIDRLGEYHPTGWQSPSVGFVREVMGDAVADAYGAVGGGARLFDATDPLTREIADRDFAKELESIVHERGAACLALPVLITPKRLTGEAA